jgi:CHAT domain-containing protein
VPRAVIQEWVDRLERSALQQDEAQFRLTASALYGYVLAPVANGVTAGRTLVFVPDATLSKVPFAALIDAHGHYLIESHPVIVAPSAAVFARLQHRAKMSNVPPRVLVIAGPAAVAGELEPLSAAGREAAAIAAAYLRPALSAPADSDRALLEKRATSAEIIHFVGHSEPRNGGDIVLVASRLAGAAGRLTVRDVAAMRFRRTRVVVLAACRTGRGQERGGEGTISIARGFIAAGVPSVVSTLWPIEDGLAAGFFPLLHRHLAAGLPAAEALRATQLECIHRGDAATGVWAAVQVLGS